MTERSEVVNYSEKKFGKSFLIVYLTTCRIITSSVRPPGGARVILST